MKYKKIRHLAAMIIGAACLLMPFALTAEQASLFEQRATYQSAVANYAAGKTTQANKQAERLADYPLYPYLQYHKLRVRLNHASGHEMQQFMKDHVELPVSPLIFNRWLKKQASKRRWKTFLKYYSGSENTELQCYYLRALYATGRKTQALDQTTALWVSPTSQPKACDPLFATWRTTSRFNEDVAWQRLHAAIQSNQRTLARYLLRFFSGQRKRAADAYYLLHTQPIKVTRYASFAKDNEKYRQVIQHGLIKLSKKQPEKAAVAWKKYKKTHSFSASAKASVEERILVGLAMADKFPAEQNRTLIESPYAIDGLAEAALKNVRWQELSYWISRLDESERSKLRWQYWLAKSLDMTFEENAIEAQQSKDIFLKLAQERQYYGFLAAQKIGQPGKLNAQQPLDTAAAVLNNLAMRGDVMRAVELFAVGDDLNGRREWYQAKKTMTPAELQQLAHLALNMGRLFLAIQTANSAEAFDDLALRFPLAFSPLFDEASHKNNTQSSLLRAIARQESAFQPSVVSSAGAQGLMQLMPATANLAARRARLPRVAPGDLKTPAKNIPLGSYHLTWLIQRYDGQRPLAIAAYNAGEHRIDRWIKGKEGVPIDIWIESIPFKETRNYVKNVLAFNVVYAHLLGNPVNVLQDAEKFVRPR
jgi:soluble lytic murein transglycosylase